jgi:hypothetical protein
VLPVFGNTEDLRDVDVLLEERPDDVSLLFQRACILDLLGRNNDARDAYIAVIKRDAGHLGALGNLGTLLFNAGFRSAARLTYAEALKHHPRDIQTLINYGNALFEAEQLEDARIVYERAIAVDPEHAMAHQGLSHVLERMGEHDEAEEHRRIGFAAMPIAISAFRGEGLPVSVLVLASALRGNVPVEVPLNDATFLRVTLFTDYYDPELPLPPHDVIFNGIGDADLCQRSLEAAEAILRAQRAQAINDPVRVLQTGRAAITRLLHGIDGLVVPRTEEISRDELDRVTAFPVLLRPPGYHTGEFFERIENREELERTARIFPGDRLLAIEQLDARGVDGFHRKYRFLVIGGVFYPIHLARSTRWKVHYFSADQARTPDAIAEEAAFLADPRSAIGERAMHALKAAAERIGLDYFGFDFGVDRDGNALLFEANATMRAVVPLASDPIQTRRAAALAANGAFRDFVVSRAATK